MKKSTLTLLCFSVSALFLGCKPSTTPSATGGVAVVDLDRVAKAMGWDSEMKKSIDEAKAKVTEQLVENLLKPAQHAVELKHDEIAKSLGFTTDAKKEEFNKAKSKEDLQKLGLSEKQIEEYGQVVAAYQNQASFANQRLNQIVQAQTQEVVKRYVDAVKPSVRRVAIAGNKSIVLMPGQGLLYNDPASDITDLVVDDMQHTPGSNTITLPPPPTLKFEAPPTPAPSSSTPTSSTPTTPAPTPTTPAPVVHPKPAPTPDRTSTPSSTSTPTPSSTSTPTPSSTTPHDDK